MFLKYSSINRHPPFLLSGFHGADFPPFNRYYEDVKTAFVRLVAFGFPRRRYRCYAAALFLRPGWQQRPRYAWTVGNRPALQPEIRAETVGSPKFPWKPPVHMPCSQTPAGCPCQTIRHVPTAPTISTIKAPTINNISWLNHTASALPAYASCQPLD